jgi:DNA-binding NarL/FixJ family response regulator
MRVLQVLDPRIAEPQGRGLRPSAFVDGAGGFLVKDTEPADLATAVRVVVRGDSLISPSMTRKLVAEFASRAKETTRRPNSMRSPSANVK